MSHLEPTSIEMYVGLDEVGAGSDCTGHVSRVVAHAVRDQQRSVGWGEHAIQGIHRTSRPPDWPEWVPGPQELMWHMEGKADIVDRRCTTRSRDAVTLSALDRFR